MTAATYQRVLAEARFIELLACGLDTSELDAAIAVACCAPAAGGAQLLRDEATLRAVRQLAQSGAILAGGGSGPVPACSEHRAGSRGTRCSSPAETVAFAGAAGGERSGPAAS